MSGIKIVTQNKKAFHDFLILDKYEAGLVLTGSEVKSLREGKCQLKDSFVEFYRGEAFLKNAHISAYSSGGYTNHEPERKRKLLMHKKELDKLDGQVREKGMSLLPLKVYFKGGKAKVELGLGKGKKDHDKRDAIKKKDVQRSLEQAKRR